MGGGRQGRLDPPLKNATKFWSNWQCCTFFVGVEWNVELVIIRLAYHDVEHVTGRIGAGGGDGAGPSAMRVSLQVKYIIQ